MPILLPPLAGVVNYWKGGLVAHSERTGGAESRDQDIDSERSYETCRSSLSAIQILMTDWRVTPRRLASRSSRSTIHDGLSTLTRCGSSPGLRALDRSRSAVTLSPCSNLRPKTLAFI